MNNRFSDRILRFMRLPGYRPVKVRPLAKQMGIRDDEYGEFRAAVNALQHVGRLVQGGGGALLLPAGPRTLTGVYRSNPRGFGFVVPENPESHADLFIPPGQALDAVSGDTVECAIESRNRGGERSTAGRIIRVVQRGHNRFVGELSLESGRWFVTPDGNRLNAPIFIADAGAKSAQRGDHVVVELVTYPAADRPAQGVIVERLGPRGQPGVDLLAIIRQHQLPDGFPAAALDDARQAIDRFDVNVALRERDDWRGAVIITIDPDDARDFDDAISLTQMNSGGSTGRGRGAGGAAWELGVHIADVSAFVREGGALDQEARERGNSTYFPRHVIPMLPEVLSNGLCSLQQDQPRLCKSAIIQYDAGGNVVGARFADTVIQSRRRLTYGEASGILGGRSGGFAPEVIELVRKMDVLARAIQKRRLAAGQIVLNLPEIELVLDDNNRVTDAVPADTSYSHTIIEMFMVEANEAVARRLDRAEVPFLRRIHPEPDDEGRETLSRFLKVAGHVLPRRLERSDLQRLLSTLKNRPESYAVNLAILKSMEQAVYSPKAEGHYALASDCYTHFTSPIRRYTDLTIHRLLGGLIGESATHRGGGRKRGRNAAVEGDSDGLAALGRHLSFTERRSADAEREFRMLKVLELLAGHIGERFDGVITGVAQFGMFVQHPRFLIDGLVRFEDMPDDYWVVDAGAGSVVGQRTRRRFNIGSLVNVEIAQVDLPNRALGLRMKAGGVRKVGPATPAPAARRMKTETGSRKSSRKGRDSRREHQRKRRRRR